MKFYNKLININVNKVYQFKKYNKDAKLQELTNLINT